MDKARKATTKTNTGKSKSRNGKSSINNPYPGVELQDLPKKSSRNEVLKKTGDIQTSTLQQLWQVNDDKTQRIDKEPRNEVNNDDLRIDDENNMKDKHEESSMEVDEDSIDESSRNTNEHSDNKEFDTLNDAISRKRNEEDTNQLYDDNESQYKKGLSIEIEFQVDGNIEQCITSITHFTMDLLKKWIQSNAIDGVFALDGKSMIKSEFEDVEAWTIPPRIIKKKQSVLAEMMVFVKSNNTAYNLYQDQKEFCDKYLIKISTKRTMMEYANKIGYLTGTYVKLASEEYYINDISRRLKLSAGMLDIKKEYTFEKGKRSKVLTVYVIENKAREINDEFSKLINTRYQFISYRKTTSDERLAGMHHNEMTNVKARYESLYNASLKELILVSSRCHERLETVLMKANYNNNRLFLAAEQGSGQYANSVTVVINPRMINKAKEWIANEYPKLQFQDEQVRETSVDPELFKVDTQYNEQLKEFLRPALQTKEAKQVKGYKKTMKSYAQAIGLDQNNGKVSSKNVIPESKSYGTEGYKVVEKINHSNEKLLQQTIDKMQIKIDKLIGLVMALTEIVTTDEEKKSEIMKAMNEIKDIEEMKISSEVKVVKTVNTEESERSNRKEITKRKEYSKKTTPYHDILNNEETKGLVSYLIHWYEDATDKSQIKRYKSNHE